MTDEWTTVPLTDHYIRGALWLEHTDDGVVPHRLPASAVAQAADPQLTMVEVQPSGVRIAFRTEATTIELDLLRSRVRYAGLPSRPDGAVDLVVDGAVVAGEHTSGGELTTLDPATGGRTVESGAAVTLRFTGLPDTVKRVELWLPHNERVAIRGVRVNAPVDSDPAGDRPRWVHHGSSISHGSNATRPTGIWPVVAARHAGVELTNLGFGGSALVDQFTARTMRDARADLLSVKLGINVVNADVMRMRAFRSAVHGFLDTVRDGHPDTPLLVISPIHCGIHETTPGPGAFDPEALVGGTIRFRATGDPAEVAAGKLTLATIRAELERIVTERRSDDPHLYFLDGLQLYGPADAEAHPLPDALHPDAATHRMIGERFARMAFTGGGPLAR